MDTELRSAINGITRLVTEMDGRMERGFAALADDITDTRDDLKGDILRVGEQVTGIEGELKDIRADLRDLRPKVENVLGFRREIDHALERINTIEKHLGIKREIAA